MQAIGPAWKLRFKLSDSERMLVLSNGVCWKNLLMMMVDIIYLPFFIGLFVNCYYSLLYLKTQRKTTTIPSIPLIYSLKKKLNETCLNLLLLLPRVINNRLFRTTALKTNKTGY